MFLRRCVDCVRAHVCACVYTHIQIVAVYHRYICISIYAYALKLICTCMLIRRCVDSVRAHVRACVYTHIQIVAVRHRYIYASPYMRMH